MPSGFDRIPYAPFAAARKKDQHSSDPELFDGSTLSLFVLWILTDNSDTSFSLDDFTFVTNRFNR